MTHEHTIAFELAGHRYTQTFIVSNVDAWQRVLGAAHAARERVRCCCIPGGVEMVVYRRDLYHVRRFPSGGPRHAPDCRSHALLDDFDPPDEGGDALYYPETHFVVDSRKAARAVPAELAGRRSGRTQPSRRRSPLSEILDIAWQRAGLRGWYPGYRALPWNAVARRLRAIAPHVRIGEATLAERCVMLAYDGEPLPLARRAADADKSARRVVVMALAPVASVKRTSRDILITPWGRESLWCEDEGILKAYQDALARSAFSDRGYVVGIFAIHHNHNWRCHDWSFMSVTHAWHPFLGAEQASLYEELVRAERTFTIPLDREAPAPWAILKDAEGGARAIVPEQLAQPIRTRLSQWRWIPGRLPRAAQNTSAPS